MVLELPTIIFQYKYVLHTFVKWVLIFMDWQAEKEWNKNYFFKWSMFVFHGIFSIFLKRSSLANPGISQELRARVTQELQ